MGRPSRHKTVDQFVVAMAKGRSINLVETGIRPYAGIAPHRRCARDVEAAIAVHFARFGTVRRRGSGALPKRYSFLHYFDQYLR